MEIRDKLFTLSDEKYKDFHKKLIPTVAVDRIIGIRTPILRKYAREIAGTAEADGFLQGLPHYYYDENNLHAFLIEQIKDFDRSLALTEEFLPYIDNWATCDLFSPPIFHKYKEEMLNKIKLWLKSGSVYTVRFGIDMLMRDFLDDSFEINHLDLVADTCCGEYYINMAVAWYFSTALVKQYDAALPFFTERRLPVWVHNKSIQKARESKRVSREIKDYLKTLTV
ncbi:MAG: DNA alkylation repair protein [Oscillospiraceae bacterium]|nr:DNA alkylation repair protein [Oscillospiraceae bacterium]